MNNNFNSNTYPNSSMFSNGVIVPNQQNAPKTNYQEYIPDEQSYIENILRVNKGKKVTIYQSFADSNDWKDKTFSGIIEQSGRDHIILSDPNTGKWYLLLMIYVNYIEFNEEINTIQQFYPSNPNNIKNY